MKLTAVICPSCGAKIKVKAGTPFCFCTYCGTQIHIDDGSTTHTHREVDEARIREAELEAMLKLKKMELAEKRRQDCKKAAKYLAVAIGALGIVALILKAFDPSLASWVGVFLALMVFWEVILLLFLVTGAGNETEGSEDDA